MARLPIGYTADDFHEAHVRLYNWLTNWWPVEGERIESSDAEDTLRDLLQHYEATEQCLTAFDELIVASDPAGSANVAEFELPFPPYPEWGEEDHTFGLIVATAHQAALGWTLKVAEWFIERTGRSTENLRDESVSPVGELLDELWRVCSDNDDFGRLNVRVTREYCLLMAHIEGEDADNRLVTAAQVAKLVHKSESAMARYRPEWPQPEKAHRGRSPAKWRWSSLFPILKQQFPDTDFSNE